MSKVLYKSCSLAGSLLGSMVAGAIFKKIWRTAAREHDTPSATDSSRAWPEILAAAALEGAIVAVVTAAVARGVATATSQITGTWPGEQDGAAEPESDKND
jgi:Protein of unknown function (DUF4235)